MRYRNKLIRNSLSLGSARFISLLCSLVLIPFVIQTIGLTQFGIWTIFSTIASIFLLLDLGLTGSFLKFISQHYTTKDFDRLNAVINSGCLFNIFLYGPILLVAFLLRRPLYTLLNIGPSVYEDTDLIFGGILLVVLIVMASSSYSAVLKSIQCLEMFSR